MKLFVNVVGCMLAVLLLLNAPVTTLATTPTPSPAPSKTPTMVPSPTPTPAVAAAPSLPNDANALTQDDLNLLTGNVQRPNGIVWFEDQLYVGCNGDWTLYKLDSRTGSTITYIFGVRNVHAMYAERDVDNEIYLWVPDFERNVLVRVSRRGLRPIADDLQGPWGIAYLDANSFLVTNLLGNSITRINRDGTRTDFLTGLRSPTGIVVDNTTIFFANNGSARRALEWTTLSNGIATPPQPLVSGLQNVTGLVLAADGYLYFAYSLGTRGVVGRIDPQGCLTDGGCTHAQVELVLYTDLASPLAGLSISPDMRLFIHTIYRPELYWVQLPNAQ